MFFTPEMSDLKQESFLNIKREAHDKWSAGHLLSPEVIHCTCPIATILLIKHSSFCPDVKASNWLMKNTLKKDLKKNWGTGD